jgi:hypothetical protein
VSFELGYSNEIQSPKTEFGAQNQYDRVTYPSIGSFTWSKKKHTFGGQKGENKPLEPKNGPKKIKTIRHFKKCKKCNLSAGRF